MRQMRRVFTNCARKSSMAVLLGLARNTDKYGVDVWWTRDERHTDNGIQIKI